MYTSHSYILLVGELELIKVLVIAVVAHEDEEETLVPAEDKPVVCLE